MDDLDKFPSQLAERFQVRLPDGMRDRLRAAAEANKRSMNAEIVARLESSFAAPEKELLGQDGISLKPTIADVATFRINYLTGLILDLLHSEVKENNKHVDCVLFSNKIKVITNQIINSDVRSREISIADLNRYIFICKSTFNQINEGSKYEGPSAQDIESAIEELTEIQRKIISQMTVHIKAQAEM